MKKFRSKVDPWLAIVIGASIVVFVGIILLSLFYRLHIVSIIMFVIALYIAWSMWIQYTVVGQDLMVTSGPMRRKISIRSIKRIQKTRSGLSSPALSLDRLEITYDGGQIMISPHRQEEFIAALKQVNPRIVVS